MILDYRDRIKGCIIGLAIGDAFGAPVEFMDKGSFPKVEKYLSRFFNDLLNLMTNQP